MVNDKLTFGIAEMAEASDVTYRTIRFYEEKKLLRPVRIGSSRLFSAYDLRRLLVIKRLAASGFTLREIEKIFPYGIEETEIVFDRKFIEEQIKFSKSKIAEYQNNLSFFENIIASYRRE